MHAVYILHVLRQTCWAEVTSKLKPITLATVKAHLSESISKSVSLLVTSQSVC